MGYNTRMRGQFTVTPPILWVDYHDKPFDPTGINDHEYRYLRFVIEPVETHGITVPAVTGLKVQHGGDGTPDVEAEFEELFALFPHHSFSGTLEAQGEEIGDLWWLTVDGRTVTRRENDPDAPTEPNVAASWILVHGRVQCRGEDVLQVLDEPYAKAWEINLISKYPDAPFYSIEHLGGDVAEFVIYVPAADHTLRTDASADTETTFTIHGLTHEWIVMAEAARYTVRIVAYRPKRMPDA